MAAPGTSGEGSDEVGPAVPGAPIPGTPVPGTGPDEPVGAPSLDDLGIVIPDDASALEEDRQALLDDQARRIGPDGAAVFASREPLPSLPRVFGRAPARGLGIGGSFVVALLLTIALIGAVMTILSPASGPVPGPQPLGVPAVGAQPGDVGGLLPAESVDLDGVPLPLQRIRPIVLAVVPRDCPQCGPLITEVQEQARAAGLRLMLVGAPDQQTQLRELSRASTNRLAGVLMDPAGGLTTLYGATTPTLVLVHSDGIIGSVIRDAAPGLRLEQQLAPLARPGGTPSTT